MIDVSVQYWFYLESSVYCNIKTNKSLLYNTVNGAKIVVKYDAVNDLIKEICKDENYGSILLGKKYLSSDDIISFILDSIEKKIGVILPANENNKPIKPLPIFRLINDIELNKFRGIEFSGKNIFQNLKIINIYVNSACKNGCRGCSYYFKQTRWCTIFENEYVEFSRKNIDCLITQISHSYISVINIIGGNVFQYKHLSYLVSKIFSLGVKIKVWSHFKHVDYLKIDVSKFELNCLVTPYFSNSDLNNIILRNPEKTIFHFVVESDIDLINANKVEVNHNNLKCFMHPVFNGCNLSFFKKNVFLYTEDIFCKVHSHREIFANQKINTNYFGILNIYPNGDVVANANSQIIGNIEYKSILDLIHSELINNTAWRRLRVNEPCANCLNQFICPSPSSYELMIGKSDLCFAYE